VLDDKRNIIIAMLLAGLILFGWPMLANQWFPQPKVATKPTEAVGSESSSDTATSGNAPIAVDVGTTTAGAASLADTLKIGPRVNIETPKLRGSINLQGARFDDLVMLTHRTQLAKDAPPVRLFSPSGTKAAYFARFGWTSAAVQVPDDKTLWTASASTLTPATPVTLSTTNTAGQKFEIVLTIDKNYLITADQRFTNSTAAPASVTPFGLISRSGKPADATQSGIATFFTRIHVGPMGVFGGVANYEWNYLDINDASAAETQFGTTGGWIGFTDRYWLAALVPDQKTPMLAKMVGKGDFYWTQMASKNPANVAVGQTFSKTSRLFAGAKEVEVLDNYVDEQGIEMLDYAIDWGWFRIIEKAFFKILNFLFGLFGSFGLAIIGLTFIVRGVMFPIAQRQFASMAQMKVIQPKMKVLQDKFKDDKPRQQQEIMKLYKEEKVNPLAGCLPIFLQMPIFFGLYKLLMLTVEMRHQPFLSPWINDLSAPDPWTPLNLFGLIPFDPPAFIAIGILPIMLGISMWGIQKLNPQPMDEVQKQVFAIMPWMMMFLFAPLAAGLQVYYVVSNTLTILQQKWLYSKHPILKQQMAKDAEEKAAAKAKA
jgi:YidC/Oxa1 family membrane protein insertase